ncbi:MAG: histidine kinase [Flavobacteriaceae bacterium]|nr:histidine kinase [Flavobacteriaceae bacterium]
MESSTILEILQHPNENGITVFVLGVLFILGTYHFLLYFQHKDKIYLYYSFYVILIFIGLLNRPNQGFIVSLVQPIKGFLDHISLNLIQSYNLVYLIFVYVLLDFKVHLKKWYKFSYISVRFLFVYAITLEVLFLITGNEQFVIKGQLPFTIAIYTVSILLYVPLFKVKSPLKYYILIGSIFLLISTLAVSVIKRLDLTPLEKEIRYSIFYIGVIIENIFFALAIGYKQKLILKEKKTSQERLMEELQENEGLRQKIHEQFKQDVATLSKRAEEEKRETLKAKYDKELTDLKMASLRSQMNPHFIFNSLNSIKRYIIENKKENAVYYLNKFSKLIRKILAATQEKEVSLANELETLELYINIENIRFNNEIDFSINIDENINIETIKIPSLILQPFIENAIWHGLSLKKENKKLSVILEKDTESHIKITIEDNGIGRERSAEIKQKKIHKRDSIGIKLTEERLSKFAEAYKNDFSLTFIDLYDENKIANGTKVILKIPIS